jgi:hypothetical protein
MVTNAQLLRHIRKVARKIMSSKGFPVDLKETGSLETEEEGTKLF